MVQHRQDAITGRELTSFGMHNHKISRCYRCQKNMTLSPVSFLQVSDIIRHVQGGMAVDFFKYVNPGQESWPKLVGHFC